MLKPSILVNKVHEMLVPTNFQFCGYWHFWKILPRFCKLGTILTLVKKWVRLPPESIAANFKSKNIKIKQLMCHFLNALFHFQITFIFKYQFWFYMRKSPKVKNLFASKSEAEKLVGAHWRSCLFIFCVAR